jgi:hypothetical protein
MVGLRWNRYLNAWEMVDERGYEMYVFRNCGNINRLYLDLDKRKINWYPQMPLRPAKQEPLPKEE